jgi:hypothetical protein
MLVALDALEIMSPRQFWDALRAAPLQATVEGQPDMKTKTLLTDPNISGPRLWQSPFTPDPS